MAADEKSLLIVAVRVDHPDDVRRRIETVLAVANTYDRPPETTPSAWCKPQSELVAADLDRLAAFIGWQGVRDLNVGDVVSPPGPDGGDSGGQRAAVGAGPAEPPTPALNQTEAPE